jgi:chromosome segregation ATPase
MGIRKEGTTKDKAIKRDLQDFKEEMIHRFHVISEGLIDQIKLLAEGHAGIIQRLDRVDTRLEGVEMRLDKVETRLDHLEKENERQHSETRALVKLSFSELDKRLSNLESQVREIQEWKKQVEARLPI